MVGAAFLVGFVACYVEDFALVLRIGVSLVGYAPGLGLVVGGWGGIGLEELP